MPKIDARQTIPAARWAGKFILILAGLMFVGAGIWAAAVGVFITNSAVATATVVAIKDDAPPELPIGPASRTVSVFEFEDAGGKTQQFEWDNTGGWYPIGAERAVRYRLDNPSDVRRDRWTLWFGPLLVGAAAGFKMLLGCVSTFVIPALMRRRLDRETRDPREPAAAG